VSGWRFGVVRVGSCGLLSCAVRVGVVVDLVVVVPDAFERLRQVIIFECGEGDAFECIGILNGDGHGAKSSFRKNSLWERIPSGW